MKKLKRILYPICAVLLLIAAWQLWNIDSSTRSAEQLYGGLAQRAKEGQADTGTEQSTASQEAANAWLLDLQKQNGELVGWIRIPGTDIDYPVMQTGSDNDYYLTHAFNREENVHGTPYLDVNCKIGESDNLIIYGHNMKDGTMFQNLMNYKDPGFCESNGTIEWDTPEESEAYQLIFVMLISVGEAERFPYYQCIDLSYEEIYEGFLKQCSRYAIWQSDDLPAPGTKLLTLSTCEYSQTDGRLVVVAKKKEGSVL